MISYCGSICADCPCYKAARTNEKEKIAAFVEQARLLHKNPYATAETIPCGGCLCDDNSRLYGHCRKCEIRYCGKNRGVVNCAYCADYACGKLDELLNRAPELKISLENIRRTI